MPKSSSAGMHNLFRFNLLCKDHYNPDAPHDLDSTIQEYVSGFSSFLKEHLPLTMAVIITKEKTEHCTESNISHPMAFWCQTLIVSLGSHNSLKMGLSILILQKEN